MAKKRTQKPFAFFANYQGQDEKSGEFTVQPTAARTIQNMHMDKLGQWSAHNQGFSHLSAQLESGTRINGLYWYTTTAGVDWLIGAVKTKVKTVNESTGAVSNISSSFTNGDIVDFETFQGTLYITSKSLAPQKWAGTGSMSAATGWPLINGGNTYDKPKVVEKYANRLVFANFNGTTKYPAHIVVSDDLAPETFTIGTNDTNAVIAQVSPGDGQAITGCKSYHVPLSNSQVLVIFKDRSIYGFEGDTPATFQIYLINPYIGAVSNNAIVQVGPDILFMDLYNIYSLTTANASGTIQPKAIGSEMVKETLADMNTSVKEKCWAQHLPERKEVWFGIPTGASSEPNKILVYSYYTGPDGQPVNAWSVRKGSIQTCSVLFNRTLFTGDSSGYVNSWFSTSAYAGTGINYIYEYPNFNFGTQAQNKKINECYLHFILNGDETITFETHWRGGGNDTRKVISVPMELAGGVAAYGTAVFGSDIYQGSGIYFKARVPVLGNGEQLQYKISGTTETASGPIFLGISGLVEYLDYSRHRL